MLTQKPTHPSLYQPYLKRTGNNPNILQWIKPTIHPYQGILFSDKKQGTIDTQNKLDESPENYAK